MLKIEDQGQNVVESRSGWYLDRYGDPWFFDKDGNAVCCFDNMGYAYADFSVDEYGPFTRLTGKIIISNEGL